MTFFLTYNQFSKDEKTVIFRAKDQPSKVDGPLEFWEKDDTHRRQMAASKIGMPAKPGIHFDLI